MALDVSSLSTNLQDLFEDSSESKSEAAIALADVYALYAAAGMFGASTLTIDGARESALASALEAGLVEPPAGSLATFAAAWATGLGAFWTAAPVVGVQSGVTNGCPGTAALPAALIAALNPQHTPATAAAAFAAALHTATGTVQATVAPPPGTVLPIV